VTDRDDSLQERFLKRVPRIIDIAGANMNKNVIARFTGVAALATLLWIPMASAQQPDDPNSLALSRTLSVGIAAGVMRFDTNFKFTDRDTGLSVFLDAEGSLQLPEVKAIPLIYGYWRPSQKHGLGFGYFSISR
jgi:hypothetical protein